MIRYQRAQNIRSVIAVFSGSAETSIYNDIEKHSGLPESNYDRLISELADRPGRWSKMVHVHVHFST